MQPVYNRTMLNTQPGWKNWLVGLVLGVLLFSAACQGQPTATPVLTNANPAGQPSPAASESPTPAAVITELPDILPSLTEVPTVPVQASVSATISVLIQTAAPATIIPPTPSPTVRSFRLPSPTPRPQPAKMRITKPGAYSKVSSPIQLEALISPGDDRLVHIDLIGEDGRIMVSEVLDFRNYDAKNFYITPEIPFTINSAAELARIVVYTDDMFGQRISLVSVEVLLMQLGGSDITAPLIELEPYLVITPREGTLITGGTVTVNGTARVVNDQPLIIELIDEQGTVVGSAEVLVSQPSDTLVHVPFQTSVPYTVTHRTRVRMSLRQESATRIPGTVWMSSTILFLDP